MGAGAAAGPDEHAVQQARPHRPLHLERRPELQPPHHLRMSRGAGGERGRSGPLCLAGVLQGSGEPAGAGAGARGSCSAVPRALLLSVSCSGAPAAHGTGSRFGELARVPSRFSGPSVRASVTRAGRLTSRSHHWPQLGHTALEGQGCREATSSARPAAQAPRPSAHQSKSRAGTPVPTHTPACGSSWWSPYFHWAQFRRSGESCCPPQPGCGDPRLLVQAHAFCVSR